MPVVTTAEYVVMVSHIRQGPPLYWPDPDTIGCSPAAAVRVPPAGPRAGAQLISVTVMIMNQAQHARAFASLHKPGKPLLLPNAWDVASAVAIADAGAKTIATTSAGVAWSLGVPDGGVLGAERAAAVIALIVAVIDVRVSADMEAGYSNVPATVT